ncbi:MAG TPA: hypothetical protein VGE74_18745, partial [Gemmata sp.]
RTLRALRVERHLNRSARFPDVRPRAPTPPGETAPNPYFELIGSPALENLRSFQMGDDSADSDDGVTDTRASAPGLEHVVGGMARLEELQLLCDGYSADALFALPNLARLQMLRVVGIGAASIGSDGAVPLDVLARNPALTSLTHLVVHPDSRLRGYAPLPLAQVRQLFHTRHLPALTHVQLRHSDMGDDGVNVIVGSPLFGRLERLDLRNGTITDAGAQALAQSRAARQLRRLDLSRNRVTQSGLELLKRAGVNAVVSTAPSRREREERDRQARSRRGTRNDYDSEERNGDWE